MTVLIAFVPNTYARNLTDQQRYSDGYSNGAQAASSDTTYNPACDPTGAYTSGGGHTPIYCKGWFDGYTATWNSQHPSPVTPIQNSPPQPPLNTQQNTSTAGTNATTSAPQITSGWQEYVVPLVNMHLGVFHNENGVFIPWRTLCNQTEQYLLKSCDQLINPDGSLTTDGDRAVGCIWNGALLTVVGIKLHLPLNTIGGLLNFGAGHTGCGDIVNINQIQSAPLVQNLQQFVH